MKWFLTIAGLGLCSVSATAAQRVLLHDSVGLNIGINCQWQSRCMAQQRRAMNAALDFVAKRRPPQWRIQLCNRNASRGANRVDWTGFNHCIHNGGLRAPTARTKVRTTRRR